ncbi:MAG: DNA mismatch endonuclease Vsr [Actinomycetota bacterium]|nr:DNA mismatch endonuclease Vsr [Actinomycetota bacterium]
MPEPIDEAKRRSMQRQREADTHPEVALRRELLRRGLRYRVQRRALPTLRRKLDVVFPSERVAVEVRGCFWHACPKHATWPHHNAAWWKAKLERNVERDAETEKALRIAGWKLIVVWEHDSPTRASAQIEKIVRARRRERTSI